MLTRKVLIILRVLRERGIATANQEYDLTNGALGAQIEFARPIELMKSPVHQLQWRGMPPPPRINETHLFYVYYSLTLWRFTWLSLVLYPDRYWNQIALLLCSDEDVIRPPILQKPTQNILRGDSRNSWYAREPTGDDAFLCVRGEKTFCIGAHQPEPKSTWAK